MQQEQQLLEGFEADPTPCRIDNLHRPDVRLRGFGFFLALTPATDAEKQFLFEHSRELHERFGISPERIQPASRIHATILDLRRELWDDDLPAQITIDGAIAALTHVRLPAVPIRFTHVRGFAGNALTLRSEPADHQPFLHLRSIVTKLLKERAGLQPRSNGQPHISLHYDLPQSIGEHSIEPIDWEAKRLALILSHVGHGHHQILAAWDLAK